MVNLALENPIVEHFISYKFENMESFTRELTKELEERAKKEDNLLIATTEKFKNNEITFGKMAEILEVSKDRAMEILKQLKIPLVKYDIEDLEEDMEFMNKVISLKQKEKNA